MSDFRGWSLALLAALALALAACDRSVDAGNASAATGRGDTDTRQMGAPAAPESSRANPGIGLTGSFPSSRANSGVGLSGSFPAESASRDSGSGR